MKKTNKNKKIKNKIKIAFIVVLMLAAAVIISAGDIIFKAGNLDVSQDLLANRIGIGTASPGNKLHVVGGDEVVLRVQKYPSGTEAVSVEGGYIYLYGGDYGFGTGDNSEFTFRVNKIEKMRITRNGNLGIGTVSPTEKLEVAGNIKGTGLCIGTDCRASWPSGGSSQWATSGSNIYYSTGNIGIGTASPAARLEITSGGNPNPNIQINSAEGRSIRIDKTGGGETLLYLTQNDAYNNNFLEAYGGGETPLLAKINGLGGAYFAGNVGIGTTSPAEKLHVVGAIKASEFKTGDITFNKDDKPVWRMFEDENGLYVESLVTGEIFKFVLEKIK